MRLTRPHDAPDPTDPGSISRWVVGGSRPTAIDLFSGAGGLSLGLRDAGFRVLAAADSDPLAIRTHEGNLGGLGFAGDLTDPTEFLEVLAGWGITTVDLVAGGPPCQAFSRAGRSRLRGLVADGVRSARDHRVELWTSFVEVVGRLSPRAVLMENVPDLAGWDDGAVLIGFLESLREMGYRVEARIMEAWRHGVPQHRNRLFIVGLRGGRAFTWPDPATDGPTVRDAIADLPAVAGAQRRECVLRWDEPASDLARRLTRDLTGVQRAVVWDHITRDVRPDDAEAFAMLPEGGTYEDLPPHLQRYRTDIFQDKYKRLEWDRQSRSITAHLAKDGYWYIHPEQHRTLSVREAARIQTFPDWFRFEGEPTHRYRQIGNAVPPLLAEALGRQLILALNTRRRRRRSADGPSFRAALLGWHAQHRRDYPWRHGVDAWHVLMAEMCLRRTRADQVEPVYRELSRIAPTPIAMTRDAEGAETAMRSLGLRWRAENVVDCARVLVDVHDGVIPNDELELQALPGVGDYVTQAVLCFGFGRRSVLIDTNTARIVARLNGRDRHGQRWQTRLDLYALAGPEGPNAEFNYALLDLGALVCVATSPRCDRCPVASMCATATEERTNKRSAGAGREVPA